MVILDWVYFVEDAASADLTSHSCQVWVHCHSWLISFVVTSVAIKFNSLETRVWSWQLVQIWVEKCTHDYPHLSIPLTNWRLAMQSFPWLTRSCQKFGFPHPYFHHFLVVLDKILVTIQVLSIPHLLVCHTFYYMGIWLHFHFTPITFPTILLVSGVVLEVLPSAVSFCFWF